MNLMRNIGASIGISLTGAMVTESARSFMKYWFRARPPTVQTCSAIGSESDQQAGAGGAQHARRAASGVRTGSMRASECRR